MITITVIPFWSNVEQLVKEFSVSGLQLVSNTGTCCYCEELLFSSLFLLFFLQAGRLFTPPLFDCFFGLWSWLVASEWYQCRRESCVLIFLCQCKSCIWIKPICINIRLLIKPVLFVWEAQWQIVSLVQSLLVTFKGCFWQPFDWDRTTSHELLKNAPSELKHRTIQ